MISFPLINLINADTKQSAKLFACLTLIIQLIMKIHTHTKNNNLAHYN